MKIGKLETIGLVVFKKNLKCKVVNARWTTNDDGQKLKIGS